MAEDKDTGLAPGIQDSQQTVIPGSASPAEGAATPATSVDYQKRFEDTQAAFTRSQQELRETQARVSEQERLWNEQRTETEKMHDTLSRLQGVFQPEQAAQTYDPEAIANLNRALEQAPIVQRLNQTLQAQEQQIAQAREVQHQRSVLSAAEKLKAKYSLTPEQENALVQHVQNDPFLLQPVLTAMDEATALRALEKAHHDWDYPNLSKNSFERGKATVEKELTRLEQASGVEKPSPSGGASPAEPAFTGNWNSFFEQSWQAAQKQLEG